MNKKIAFVVIFLMLLCVMGVGAQVGTWTTPVGATAGSTYAGFPASLVRDDDPASFWQAAGGVDYEYVQVDMGASVRVAGARAWFSVVSGAVRTERVYTSNDGTVWTERYSNVAMWDAEGDWSGYAFTAVDARYLRLYVKRSSSYTAFMNECDIDVVPVTPTPSATPSATTTPSVTPTSTATPGVTPTSTATPGVTPTSTATPGVTPSATATPSANAGACETIAAAVATLAAVTPAVMTSCGNDCGNDCCMNARDAAFFAACLKFEEEEKCYGIMQLLGQP
jgi:hypothetical protein